MFMSKIPNHFKVSLSTLSTGIIGKVNLQFFSLVHFRNGRQTNSPRSEKKKAYTTTTERKFVGELFWPQRKTFQAGGGYKNPIKLRQAISTTNFFPLWSPFFGKEKFLTGGGRCMLSFSRADFLLQLRS